MLTKFKSRSYKKTMAALAFTEGLSGILAERVTGTGFEARIKPLALRVSEITNTCIRTIPALLTQKEVRRFKRNLNLLAEKHLSGPIDAVSLITYSSFLLDEPLNKLQPGAWRDLIQQASDLMVEILSIYEEVDGLVQGAQFDQADKIRRFWEGLEW